MIRALALFLFLSTAAAADTDRPQPPILRLGDIAGPIHYSVHLTIVPSSEVFSGTVEIDMELREGTPLLWLNGTGLTIREAVLATGSQEISAKVVSSNEDFIGFGFHTPVGPGRAKMRIQYEGKISAKDNDGLFKQEDRGEWYVYSQFEEIDARRAFPCFDEPGYKVPWQLTLHVKKEHAALSNTPVVSETEEANGMKAVQFAETKPLPSYLIALAVGPFEFVDAGKCCQKGTQIRIVTPRGRTKEARWAAESTPEILALLETYFGIPYPFEKLDQIAIPKVGFAMENPGLITYGQTLLLSQPEVQTIRSKRSFASVCAHEIAHQWFGDLVTMSWWNDIWLNEAFASWMAQKIMEQFKPEWEEKISKVEGRNYSMSDDQLVTSRKIRQPIESKDDIRNAFDNITYGKGEAILEMFESWVGQENFQKGVREYLTKHLWANATAEDFLFAVTAASGQDLAPAISTFLDQTGAPNISIQLVCNQDTPAVLKLNQQRYLPAGSKSSKQQIWQIPVCVKYAAEKDEQRECMLMKDPEAEFTLKQTGSCPKWVLSNEDAAGYYYTSYPNTLIQPLLQDGEKHLSIAERVGLINDLKAAMESGQMRASDVLSYIPLLLKDPNRHIITATMDLIYRLDDHLVPDHSRANFARFIRETYGVKARELGWKTRPDEDENTQLLRRSLVRLVADKGEDAVLEKEAHELASGWLQDRKTVDPEMADAVLYIAAKRGDQALFDGYHQAALETQDLRERRWLLSAMGMFLDPVLLEKALSLVLSGEFDIREGTTLMWTSLGRRETRSRAYNFVTRNFDALVAKLPRDSGAYLSFAAASVYCDSKGKAEAENFFYGRSTQYVGGPRILDQVLESIELCSALRNIQQPGINEFLKKY